MIVCMYPYIYLHDSVIEKIEYDEKNSSITIFCEDENGFKVKKDGKGYRAKNARIEIILAEETDIDYEFVSMVRYIPVFRKWALTRYKEMTLRDFIKKINSKKIQAEIVDEFYNGYSVYYKVSTGLRKKCSFTISYKDIRYLYDGIQNESLK